MAIINDMVSSNKVICSPCYNLDSSLFIKGYTKFDGLSQHLRIKHGLKLTSQLKDECSSLTCELHGNETCKSLKKFCSEKYDQFIKEYNMEAPKCSKVLTLKAKRPREAVKYFGLALMHFGHLKDLSCDPIDVIIKSDVSSLEYKLSRLDTKIYVEQVKSTTEVIWDLVPDSLQSNLNPHSLMYSEGASSNSLKDIMSHVFGFSSFRPGQEEAIINVVKQNDTIVILPTGGGKSLIYTLPGLVLPGMTLVVSPLLMLMYDQVARLRQLGINTCFYNSLVSEDEKKAIIKELKNDNCQYKFLFITPEGILTDLFMNCLEFMVSNSRISFVAVDEAHCIATWGKHFRPDYQNLKILKSKFSLPVLALTGTATKITIKSISLELCLKEPVVYKLSCVRSNLSYQVQPKPPTKIKEFLVKNISDHNIDFDCAIIYCGTQSMSVDMAFELKKCGLNTTYYHAGLEKEEKINNANLWLEGKANIICCTNAFGMGIDKKDVRYVFHLSMPNSFEDLLQESGRAGRDGNLSTCILYYSFNDRSFHLSNISKIENDYIRYEFIALLNKMTEYCTSDECRQLLFKSYFDDSCKELEKCENCDNCQQNIVIRKVKTDMTPVVIEIIECLNSMSFFKKFIKLVEIASCYMGSKSKEIVNNKLHLADNYGKGKQHFKSIPGVTKFLQTLIMRDVLKENYKFLSDNYLIYITSNTSNAYKIHRKEESFFY